MDPSVYPLDHDGRCLQRSLLRCIFCLVLALILVACASAPPTSSGHWVNGRLSVRNGNDSFYANFSWESTPDKDHIDLSNPLGQIEAQVEVYYHEGQAVRAQFEQGGRIEKSDNPDELLANIHGPPLPISQLRWWMHGQVAPGPSQVEVTENGKLIQQAGWRIEMHYTDDHSTPDLPLLKRLDLSRGPLSIRMVISR